MQCKLGSKAVRRGATRQDRQGAWRWLGRINTYALIKFPFPFPELWILRVCRSLLMPILTMLMAYHDQKNALSRASLSVLSPVPKLCHLTTHLGPTTLHPISSHPTVHHLTHTHTILRVHRHVIQRTRPLRGPRICRSLTPSPR